MINEIKPELLQYLYKLSMQYCVAKFGKEPNKLEVLEDGSLKAVYCEYCHGEHYEDEQYFSADCLTHDLVEVYEMRKKAEEEAKRQQEEQRKRKEEMRIKMEKEERRIKYLELKREFEP